MRNRHNLSLHATKIESVPAPLAPLAIRILRSAAIVSDYRFPFNHPTLTYFERFIFDTYDSIAYHLSALLA